MPAEAPARNPPGPIWTPPLIMGLVGMICAMAGFAALLMVDMASEKLAIMAGFVGMAFGWGTAAVNFHLGSSLSSQGKDGTINSFMDRVGR